MNYRFDCTCFLSLNFCMNVEQVGHLDFKPSKVTGRAVAGADSAESLGVASSCLEMFHLPRCWAALAVRGAHVASRRLRTGHVKFPVMYLAG